MSNFHLEPALTRSVWKKLKDGPVPIVESSDFLSLRQFVGEYNGKLKKRSYIPEVVHGYLGLQKGNGVTRFLPIIPKEDMAVYYHLCGHIGERALKKKNGIYGGWRSIPVSSKRVVVDPRKENSEQNAIVSQEGYFSDTFSNTMWLDEFRGFTQLIRKLTKSASSGAYVATTDIANFYDSIEIPRLTERLRRDMPQEPEAIELLEVFLNLWDRRTTGYSRSSKGIPQEIISDGSRFLSHYYLQDFDDKFRNYCDKVGLLYIRWADDMLIFGPSTKLLEHAIHRASRLLLPDGLNLNAHKTRFYKRDELAKYRGIDVLSAIETGNPVEFRRKLRSAIAWHRAGNPMRLDTVFRATLGYTFRLRHRARAYEKSFLMETTEENPEIVASLNDLQLVRLIAIADDSKEMFLTIRRACLTRPYAGARANFLMLIRKHTNALERLGVSHRLLTYSVAAVEKESADSEIILNFCAPSVRKTLS